MQSHTSSAYGPSPISGMTSSAYGPSTSSSAYGPSPTGMSVKQTFTEGTVYQLARVLYAVHTNFESQPTEAIREAIKTFGDDPDRNIILQAARGAADALDRKRFILLNSSKTQSTMTVFDQMVSLKEQRLQTTDKNLRKILDSQTEMEGGATEESKTEYSQLYQLRAVLKKQIFDADYSQQEIDEAKKRLFKIKQIEESAGSPTEDTISQMKNIWKQ